MSRTLDVEAEPPGSGVVGSPGTDGDSLMHYMSQDSPTDKETQSHTATSQAEEDDEYNSRDGSGTDMEKEASDPGRSLLTEELLRRREGVSPSFENLNLGTFQEGTPEILLQLQKRAALLDSRELGLRALKEQLLAQARADSETLHAEREALNAQMEDQRQRLDVQMGDIEERLRQLHAQIQEADGRAQQLSALEEELFQREKLLAHREKEFLNRIQGKAPIPLSDSFCSTHNISDPYVYTYPDDAMEVVAVSLLIIASLTTGVICYLLKCIMVPFLFSIMLMYIFKPCVDFVSQPFYFCDCKNTTKERQSSQTGCLSALCGRRRCKIVFVPRWLATLFSIGICLAALGALGFTVARSIQNVQHMKDKYLHGAVILATRVEALLRLLNVDLQKGLMPRIMTFVQQFLIQAINAASEYAGQLFVVLVFLAFLLLAPIGLSSPSHGTTEASGQRRTQHKTWNKINMQVRKYIQIKTLISGMVGLIVWAIWHHLGVDCDVLLALLTGLANYIPAFGPFIATLFPFPLVILNPNMPVLAKVMALVLPLCLHMCVGNFVEPMILGTQFALHPVTVLLSVAFWGYLWDIAGLILAVPMMASLQIVLANVDYPLAHAASCILAGRMRPSSASVPSVAKVQ